VKIAADRQRRAIAAGDLPAWTDRRDRGHEAELDPTSNRQLAIEGPALGRDGRREPLDLGREAFDLLPEPGDVGAEIGDRRDLGGVGADRIAKRHRAPGAVLRTPRLRPA